MQFVSNSSLSLMLSLSLSSFNPSHFPHCLPYSTCHLLSPSPEFLLSNFLWSTFTPLSALGSSGYTLKYNDLLALGSSGYTLKYNDLKLDLWIRDTVAFVFLGPAWGILCNIFSIYLENFKLFMGVWLIFIEITCPTIFKHLNILPTGEWA